MKICFLAPANNYHTQKWCEYFSNQGHIIDVISFTPGNIENVNVHYINSGANSKGSDFSKIRYLLNISKIKKIINQITPDIINAHYATSYGMIAALTVPNNFILSVWGSDVYEFPKKSFIHKSYFKYILKKSKLIFSTSNCMAEEINKYTSKNVIITPFGVKMDLFNPDKKLTKNKKEFVVGTAKPIEKKYGIKNIIEAINFIKDNRPDINIKAKIAGNGSKEEAYKSIAQEKNLPIEWLGFLPQEKIAFEFANMDIALFPSTTDSESFGVATIEAEACEIPVIVSNTPGLLETTISKKTSLVIPKNNSEDLAKAIIKLYDNPELRISMGKNGRQYVLENYEYNMCFKNIEKLFKELQ